ncbi:MAG TPA: hypothetical protein VJT74_12590, partial [Pyrinomonadaceae bacterium]|nr:hypothetical protein [Pyrinomonadaceae bacterium]
QMKIPFRKTDRFIFICNAQDPLADERNPHPEIVEAFLISEQYSTANALARIKRAQARKKLIISDNGNFSRISTFSKRYVQKGRELVDAAARAKESGRKLPRTLLRERSKLIDAIRQDLSAQQSDSVSSKIIERQLLCAPYYLIGLEDYTIPVLGMAGLLDPVFEHVPDDIQAFQQATRDIYVRQRDGIFGNKEKLTGTVKYLVHHAYDYDTGLQAARITRGISPDGIAVSFAGAMASRSYINSLRLGNSVVQFTESLPEPYLLGSAILLGVMKAARPETPIHLLGLGSPILIILLSQLLRRSRAISIDSTATFKDADDGTIYGSRNAYLKMDMYKVAAHALVTDEPYHSSSPWFSTFEKKYPSDWKSLQRALKVTDKTDVGQLAKKLKASPKLLERYAPFFTPMRAGTSEFLKDVRVARAGCNYWVLKKLCTEVRKRIDKGDALGRWVEGEVERYAEFGSPKWVAAVRECHRIIKKYS